MALVNSSIGAAILASIGWKGQRPDFIPARLATKPEQMLDRNGRPYMGATVITAQKNLQGETYLSERVHNLQFAFDRTDRVEILDGPAGNPLSIGDLIRNKQEAQYAFAMSRPETGTVNLSEEPVALAEAPAKDKEDKAAK